MGGFGGGSYDVTAGPHTYHLPGKYVIHTHVADDGWSHADIDTTITVDPVDPWTLDLEGRPVFGTEQESVGGTLAKFTAADNQTALAALIDWGDDTGWQKGDVNRVAFERFGVSGSHTYASYGSYFVRIEVEDGTRANMVGTTAVIQDAAISVSVNSLTVRPTPPCRMWSWGRSTSRSTPSGITQPRSTGAMDRLPEDRSYKLLARR